LIDRALENRPLHGGSKIIRRLRVQYLAIPLWSRQRTLHQFRIVLVVFEVKYSQGFFHGMKGPNAGGRIWANGVVNKGTVKKYLREVRSLKSG
jgi:hypothetical protein